MVVYKSPQPREPEPEPDEKYKHFPDISNLPDVEVSRMVNHPLRVAAERIVGGIGAVAVAPIVLLGATAFFMETRQNPFLKQSRLGKGGKEFGMLKLRTLRGGDHCTVSHGIYDKRVSKIGKFLRATRIDELPQTINIALGHMSIMGLRAPNQAQAHSWMDNGQQARLAANIAGRPGAFSTVTEYNCGLTQDQRSNHDWTTREEEIALSFISGMSLRTYATIPRNLMKVITSTIRLYRQKQEPVTPRQEPDTPVPAWPSYRPEQGPIRWNWHL